MSSTPNLHGDETPVVVEGGGLPFRWVSLLFAVAFALVAYLLYAGYTEREAAKKGLADADKKTQSVGVRTGQDQHANRGFEGPA